LHIKKWLQFQVATNYIFIVIIIWDRYQQQNKLPACLWNCNPNVALPPYCPALLAH
jgi:hypothetical protein